MSKSGQGKRTSTSRRKKSSARQLVLAIVVIAALASSWLYFTGAPTSESSSADSEEPTPSVVVQGLENRMVLPATPRTPRPATLNPAAFDEPETKAAYQAAKDSPEALENVSCYCGCFGNAGHRNSLDCFTDSHGAT
jgi:Protein of unknown function with PCYCGC motif